MGLPLPPLLGAVAKPVIDIIDKFVLDKDLAQQMQNDLAVEMLRAEADITAAASSVIMAEAQGESWLQRNWRPMLMVWFSILIGAYWFGWVPSNLPEAAVLELFSLVQIGIGGYVVGRSAEKITKNISPMFGPKSPPELK